MKDLTELIGKSEKVELIGRPVLFLINNQKNTLRKGIYATPVEKIRNEISRLAPEDADSYNAGWLFINQKDTNIQETEGIIAIQYCKRLSK